LTALVASGLLSATTLAAAFLWEKRTAVHPSLLRLGLVASAALFCSVLLVVVALAPKRADLDFAGRIDTAKQSIAMLKEDGDTLALSLEETHLSRLEEQRSQAATFYQAVAVAAGVLEGGTSLAVPSGYILMSYLGAQGLVRRRTAEVTKARNRVARSRERFAARMSRLLERAGVTQDQLGPLLRGAGGQSPQAPPRPNPPPDSLPPAPPPVPPSPDHEPTVPPQGDGPQDGPRDQGPGTGPDPSFDQS
jgi:hypothetical protein